MKVWGRRILRSAIVYNSRKFYQTKARSGREKILNKVKTIGRLSPSSRTKTKQDDTYPVSCIIVNYIGKLIFLQYKLQNRILH